VDAAALLGVETVGTFIGRHPGLSVKENVELAERVLPPLVDYAGERGIKIIIENCVMEGWHPDGYPGNIAYSPELWEWMFSLGLYLNYDPSHLLWLGIDPVTALKPYVDRIPHAQAKDAQLDPAAREPLRVLRQDDQPRAPLGRGLVALPGARPRPGGLERRGRRPVRGRIHRRALGRARGPGVERHRGEGQAGPGDRVPRAASADHRLTGARGTSPRRHRHKID
jgi:hypothetical protein